MSTKFNELSTKTANPLGGIKTNIRCPFADFIEEGICTKCPGHFGEHIKCDGNCTIDKISQRPVETKPENICLLTGGKGTIVYLSEDQIEGLIAGNIVMVGDMIIAKGNRPNPTKKRGLSYGYEEEIKEVTLEEPVESETVSDPIKLEEESPLPPVVNDLLDEEEIEFNASKEEVKEDEPAEDFSTVYDDPHEPEVTPLREAIRSRLGDAVFIDSNPVKSGPVGYSTGEIKGMFDGTPVNKFKIPAEGIFGNGSIVEVLNPIRYENVIDEISLHRFSKRRRKIGFAIDD